MKPEWRRLLDRRSVLDKIAVAIDCDVLDPSDLPIVAELVREGIWTWVDCTSLRMLLIVDGTARSWVNVDIYQLTPKGIELCDANNIERH